MENHKLSNKKIVLSLSLAAIVMFGFGFALAPLYQLICSVTGLNSIGGTIDARKTISDYKNIDQTLSERKITLQLDTTLEKGLDWQFKPVEKQLKVQVGEVSQTSFIFTNTFDYSVVTQAVPSVTPWQAAEHIKKIECFCFNQQTLAAGENKVMPLTFVIDPDLPKDIKTVTLSYTLMAVDNKIAENTKQNF